MWRTMIMPVLFRPPVFRKPDVRLFSGVFFVSQEKSATDM
jgi:hypothetical protein